MEIGEEYPRREQGSQGYQDDQDGGNISGGTSPDGTATNDLNSDLYTENGRTKGRKPYTITKQREKWTDDEHLKFLEALKLYGRAWRKIEDHIGSKTAVQIRSHAQKFFSKIEKKKEHGAVNHSEDHISIPPPRPKRKPCKPYPRKELPLETSANGDASRIAGTGGASQRPAGTSAGPAATRQLNTSHTHADPEVTDATVAAVAAAASAAAAAAAAAVVAAAGQQVQAHLQANPPQGFPFFGVPPSVLAQFTVLHGPQYEALAQKGGQHGWTSRQPQRIGSQNDGELSLGDRVWQQMHANLQSMAEATATTDGGTRMSISVQTHSSDGDSACSRETSNSEDEQHTAPAWQSRQQRQGSQSMPLRPHAVTTRPASDGQIPATYLQLLAGLRDAAKGSSHPAPAPLGVEQGGRRKVERSDGSNSSGGSRKNAGGDDPAGKQGGSGCGSQEYSDNAAAGAGGSGHMPEPTSPSIQEHGMKHPSEHTNASGSNQTNGSAGSLQHKKLASKGDTAQREAQASNPTNDASAYGSSGNGNGAGNNSSAGNGNGHSTAGHTPAKKTDGNSGNADGSSGNANGSSGNANGSSGNANGSSGNANGSSGNANGSSGNGQGSSGNGNGSSGNGNTLGGNGHSVKDSNNEERGGHSYAHGSTAAMPHAGASFGGPGPLAQAHFSAAATPFGMALPPHVGLPADPAASHLQAIMAALQAQAAMGHPMMYHGAPALSRAMLAGFTPPPPPPSLPTMDGASVTAFCQQLLTAAAMARPGMLQGGPQSPAAPVDMETFEALIARAAGVALPMMAQPPEPGVPMLHIPPRDSYPAAPTHMELGAPQPRAEKRPSGPLENAAPPKKRAIQ